MAIIVVKQDIECTMWSVALVSMTQSVVPKQILLTSLAEKMEYVKFGLKARLETIPVLTPYFATPI